MFDGDSLGAPEVAAAYGPAGTLRGRGSGAGVTVALFEGRTVLGISNVAAYQKCYGTSASVRGVNVSGGPGAYAGKGEEAELDIKQVIGLAPQAKILVYQGPTTGAANIASGNHLQDRLGRRGAGDLDSYATCEQETEWSVVLAENTLLEETASQGQSFVAASGDNGSEACSASEPEEEGALGAEPGVGRGFATAVGGTSLYSEEGEWKQTLWNDLSPELVEYGAGATGGGVSIDFVLPFYQEEAASFLHVIQPGYSSNVPCSIPAGYCRELPNVSADADPYTSYMIHAEGEWKPAGGTSGAAPLWAALFALADSSRECKGVPVGFADPALYKLASSEYANDFYDIAQNELQSVHQFSHADERLVLGNCLRDWFVSGRGRLRHGDGLGGSERRSFSAGALQAGHGEAHGRRSGSGEEARRRRSRGEEAGGRRSDGEEVEGRSGDGEEAEGRRSA